MLTGAPNIAQSYSNNIRWCINNSLATRISCQIVTHLAQLTADFAIHKRTHHRGTGRQKSEEKLVSRGDCRFLVWTSGAKCQLACLGSS